MSWFLTGDDDWQGEECTDIEGELMRRGGRLSEWLTARERDLASRMKLAFRFAVHWDSPSLVIMFCYCQIISKLPVRHLCVVNHVCTSTDMDSKEAVTSDLASLWRVIGEFVVTHKIPKNRGGTVSEGGQQSWRWSFLSPRAEFRAQSVHSHMPSEGRERTGHGCSFSNLSLPR